MKGGREERRKTAGQRNSRRRRQRESTEHTRRRTEKEGRPASNNRSERRSMEPRREGGRANKFKVGPKEGKSPNRRGNNYGIKSLRVLSRA